MTGTLKVKHKSRSPQKTLTHKFCGLHRRIIADVGPSHGRLNPRGKGTGRGKSGMFACHLPSVICLANCPDLRNRQR